MPMLLAALVLLAPASAQVTRPSENPSQTTLDAFEAIESLISAGIIFVIPAGGLDQTMSRHGFSKVGGTEMAGGGGRWVREDALGTVSVNVYIPSPLTKERNDANLNYFPREVLPMPSEVLRHLFSTATKTELAGVDRLQMTFPTATQSVATQCSIQRQMVISLNSGAMLSHRVSVSCAVSR